MTTANKATPKRGFQNLRCPLCGADDSIRIVAADVTTFLECAECGDEFGRNEIRSTIDQWERLLAWLDTAPEVEG